MKKTLFIVLALVLGTAGVLYAEDGVTDSEVVLGMVNAQKGPASGLGQGMLMGADAVFKDINEKGGVGGRKVRLAVADDGYEPNKTVDETIDMIENKKVFALFGYVGTPTANAAIPIVKDAKIPLVGLFTGAMTLRDPVTRYIINVRASYDDETEALVDYFIKKGAKTFGVFYQDDGFGYAVLSGTEKALKKRGIEVTAKGTFQRNTTAVKSGLANMLKAQPDVVVMVGPYTPLAVFVAEARDEGLKSQLATVSFVGTDSLVEKVGAKGDGVVISQVVPFPDDLSLPVTKECEKVIKKYNPGASLRFVNFEGCVTAMVMAEGLKKAGGNLTRESLIDVFEGMSGLDLGGVKLKLGPSDHQALDEVFLTEIKGGRIAKIGD